MHFRNLTIYNLLKFLYNDNVIKIQKERGTRMSNLNSIFLKQERNSKKFNSYVLHIKGDWNDSDYITEETEWTVEEMNYSLPYFSILLDLFNFDSEYRRKTHNWSIDITEDMVSALERYFNHNNGFYPELLALKNASKVFSKQVAALSEDEFKNLYDMTVADLKEYIEDECLDSLPTSYEGSTVHTIKEMYIEHQGVKFDVRAGKVVEALAEFMNRMCK